MSASPGRDAVDRQGAPVRRRDQECDRFEAAWKAGKRPRVEDCLAAVPAEERDALLRELIPLEVDYRRLAGERPTQEEFLGRFPALDHAWLRSVFSRDTAPSALPGRPGVESAPAPLREATTLPAAGPEPLQLSLAVGAGRDPGDISTLLWKRLRFVSLVILGLYSYSLVMLGIALLNDVNPLPQRWLAYCWPYPLVWTTAAALAVVLWRKRAPSLRQLRWMERVLFGLVLLQMGWELGCDWFLKPPFAGAAGWANTSEGYFLWLYAAYTSMGFVLLIITYATLIPSTARQCTLNVGLTALTPLLISAAGCFATGTDPAGFARYYLVPMTIYLAIAAAIAAYGTRRMELLRQEAVQARKLGQYRLKQVLGRGGMGEVYLAEHVLLKQPCAVKLIRPDRTGDPDVLRRFEREVQATARLKHWNTVQIYDYGRTADGAFYYVMEYLAGVTLEQLVKTHGPLPPGRAAHLLRQACLALREAHALGLIHRDIKPSNIMLCERGGVADVVKLLDFGLVKAVGLGSKEETLTQEGAITGTPAYMSPEQASGSERLDGRTDIYSLGGVAYFLLTGQPPFVRDGAIPMIVAHVHEPVRPPAELRPEVPADLQAVVLRCLEKDPARRFADVSRLHDALAPWDRADP